MTDPNNPYAAYGGSAMQAPPPSPSDPYAVYGGKISDSGSSIPAGMKIQHVGSQERLVSAQPPPNSTGMLGGYVDEFWNAIKSPIELYKPPESPEEDVIFGMQGPGGLASYRLVKGEFQSRREAFKQAGEQFKAARHIEGSPLLKTNEYLRSGITGFTGALPVPGIAAISTNINRVADSGNLPEMWGRGLADALMIGAGARTPKSSPVTPIDYLTAAGGEATHAPLTETWASIRAAVDKMPTPPRTPDDYLSAVKGTKDAFNDEFANAIGPVGNTKVGLDAAGNTPISSRILAMITPNLKNTAAGRVVEAQLRKAAAEFQKPWTLQELNQERIDANNRFYAKDYDSSTLRGKNRTPAIDKAIADGTREMIYPALDDIYGKPRGYYAEMQDQTANLIDLEKLLKNRVETLKGKSAASRGAPRFKTEDISISGHPGSMPRAGFYGLRNLIFREDPYRTASSRVAKGFNPKPPVPVGRITAVAGGVGADQEQQERARAITEWVRQQFSQQGGAQ
jgi:hypothetical protein